MSYIESLMGVKCPGHLGNVAALTACVDSHLDYIAHWELHSDFCDQGKFIGHDTGKKYIHKTMIQARIWLDSLCYHVHLYYEYKYTYKFVWAVKSGAFDEFC